jgi:hypothetical protein
MEYIVNLLLYSILFIIGLLAGFFLTRLMLRLKGRILMRNAMLRSGAIIDVCDKCLKNTPIYRDGVCHCLYCTNQIGIPRKLVQKRVQPTNGLWKIEFEQFSLRPNEFMDGGF